jgi:hypothetical protein
MMMGVLMALETGALILIQRQSMGEVMILTEQEMAVERVEKKDGMMDKTSVNVSDQESEKASEARLKLVSRRHCVLLG